MAALERMGLAHLAPGLARICPGGAQQWASLPRYAEQTSKRMMCRPTRKWNRGRLKRLGEMSMWSAAVVCLAS